MQNKKRNLYRSDLRTPLLLCAIIGVVGILNFFNTVMMSILSQKREYSVAGSGLSSLDKLTNAYNRSGNEIIDIIFEYGVNNIEIS